ncbi:Gfo/Idh/MocA family oxidoreductase [uncultured Croceitalea sp.]|uniref:Gfo/Idh/MocA family protein n=1 Tax=uncultured Croceitalea sp. TaxID=1798908 RepID=UPI00330602D5
MGKNIQWGIVGLGKIAQHFADDLKLDSEAELKAVASRSMDKAKEFAEKNNARTSYDSYEALFNDPAVDVVYIATPHSFHKNVAIQAMRAGKHVLCEKPLGVNRTEVEAMLSAAKENGVFLMEALWSRFNPTIVKMLQLVTDGTLGELKYINADFGFYGMDRPLESRLFNLDLAGGTILDIGIYPVFLSYILMGMPREIAAFSNFNAIGTEIQTSAIFQYEGAQAVLNSSFTNETRMSAEISGTQGSIYLSPRWHEAQGYELKTADGVEKVNLPTIGRGYTHEILEVHRCLQENKTESKLWSHRNSLELITLLDMIRTKTGTQFPFEV